MDYAPQHQQYENDQYYELTPTEIKTDTEYRQEIEPIYVMTVELEEGKSQTIKIFADSTPEELAFEFCKKNNLDLSSMNYLSSQIRTLLEEIGETLTNEQEAIQEVDEEDYQTETRKTNKSASQSLTKVNPLHVSNKSMEHELTGNLYKQLSKNRQLSNLTNIEINKASHDDVSPFVKKEIPSVKRLSEYDPGNQNNLENLEKILKMKNNENTIKDSYNIFTTDEINYRNEILDTKELMKGHEEAISNQNNKSQQSDLHTVQHSIDINDNQNSSKIDQKLFSYQVLTESSKNKLVKNKPKIKTAETSKKYEKKFESEIFERLYRNSEYKRAGAFRSGELTSSTSKPINNYIADSKTKSKTINTSSSIRDTRKNNASADNSNNKSRFSVKNGEVINYGERLYQKGIKLKEETQKRVDEYKRDLENFNSNIYTFKPKITDYSSEMAMKRADASLFDNENLIKYSQYLDEKLEKLRQKHDPRIDYSFSPTLNKNSEKIALERLQAKLNAKNKNNENDSHKIRIDDLYENFKVKQFRLNELTKQFYSDYSFTPQINQNYNNSEILNANFEQRQQFFRRRSEEKMSQLRKDAASSYDKVTGQSLYIPRILNKSRDRGTGENENSMNNNSRGLTSSIYQSLYSYAQKYDRNKQERMKDVSFNIKKFSESVHTSNDSAFIFSQKKEDAFRKIFRILDSDEDDCISSLSMDLRKLDKEVENILKPIFVELKEENETLNENEFIRACEHLYEMLNYSDKRKLLEFNYKKSDNRRFIEPEFTFTPKIDRNSKRIDERNMARFYQRSVK